MTHRMIAAGCLALVIVFLGGCILLDTFLDFGWDGQDDVTLRYSVKSPDGRFEVSVIEISGGGGAGYVYHQVIVHKAGEDPIKLIGSDADVSPDEMSQYPMDGFRWIDATTVELRAGKSRTIFGSRKDRVGVVHVVYVE